MALTRNAHPAPEILGLTFVVRRMWPPYNCLISIRKLKIDQLKQERERT